MVGGNQFASIAYLHGNDLVEKDMLVAETETAIRAGSQSKRNSGIPCRSNWFGF